MGILALGTELRSVTGTAYTVERFLSAGTQGEIYLVKSEDGNAFALKVYYPHFAANPDLREDLVYLTTQKKSPSASFVWPKELVALEQQWGYIMNYADLSLTKTIFEEDELMSRDLAAKVCLNIAKAMGALHLSGLCYKDLSPNNFEYHPVSGEVVIFDCDNINQKGRKCTVSGTPGYRAPEIVLGNSYPDDLSDLYSMATIFFKIWMGADVAPLEGKNMSKFSGILDNGASLSVSEAERYLYGSNPIFIFDPKNTQNELEDNEIGECKKLLWQYFTPRELKQLWNVTFTVGLKNPLSRAGDARWVAALQSVLSKIEPCAECGIMNTDSQYCIDCHRKIRD